MPPFWVTTKPPSEAGAAAFAPPPTTATVDIAPVARSTRYSAPSATLVHTTSVGHHTGPSGKRTRGTTTTVSDMARNLSLPVASAPVSGATTNASRILVVRHGQSIWNAASKWQGQARPALSPLGVEQSELAAKAIDRADLVWSPDLERAQPHGPNPHRPLCNPHNLRPQATSFIGRESEVAELQAAVKAHRLVTLTGVGGVGKTRLATEVAAQLSDEFPTGSGFSTSPRSPIRLQYRTRWRRCWASPNSRARA